MPLPMLETTPPVTKTNLAMTPRVTLQCTEHPKGVRTPSIYPSSRLRNIQAVFS